MDTTITADELKAMTVVQIKAHSLYKNCGLVGKSKLRKADLIRELIAWRTRAQTRRNDAAHTRVARENQRQQPLRAVNQPGASSARAISRENIRDKPGPCPNDYLTDLQNIQTMSRVLPPQSRGRSGSRARRSDSPHRSASRVRSGSRARRSDSQSPTRGGSRVRGRGSPNIVQIPLRRETRLPPKSKQYPLSRKMIDRIILELTNIGTGYHLLKDIDRANAYDTVVHNIKTEQPTTLQNIKKLPGVGSSISLDIDELLDKGFTNRMEDLKNGPLDEILYRVTLFLNSKYL